MHSTITNEVALLLQINNKICATQYHIQGAGGNISVKVCDNNMLIKPSGVLLNNVLTASDMVSVNYRHIKNELTKESFDVLDNDDIIGIDTLYAQYALDGKRPSMETGFHCLLYKYVVHTHNVYANVLLCSSHYHLLETCLSSTEAYTVCMLKDYYTPGTVLSWHIYNTNRYYETMPNVILLPNHGIIYSSNSAAELDTIITDVQQRIDNVLQLNNKAYPQFTITNNIEQGYTVYCNYLFEVWSTIPWHIIHQELLFPDQAIYILPNTLGLHNDAIIKIDIAAKCMYSILNHKALTAIIEIVLAYYVLQHTMYNKGYEPLTINYAWDTLRTMPSEQYRINLK